MAGLGELTCNLRSDDVLGRNVHNVLGLVGNGVQHVAESR